MSEIRRVAVKMNNIDCITTACEAAGLELVKQKDRILVRNHGVATYGGRDLSLVKQQDGTYVMEGDCSKSELDKLVGKIKAHYAESIIVKTTASQGYNIVNRQVENNKIKIRLRAFV